jgi:hypothetical protein
MLAGEATGATGWDKPLRRIKSVKLGPGSSAGGNMGRVIEANPTGSGMGAMQ